MSKTAKLDQEIKTRRVRLGELEAEASRAARELTAQRARHVKGEITTGDVVQATLTHDTLQGAIKALQAELGQLETERAATAERESRAARRRAIADHLQEATNAVEELNQCRREALQALEPFLQRAAAIRRRQTAARVRAVELLGEEAGGSLYGHFLNNGLFRYALEVKRGIEQEYGVDGAGVHVVTNIEGEARMTVFQYTGAPDNADKDPRMLSLWKLETAAAAEKPNEGGAHETHKALTAVH